MSRRFVRGATPSVNGVSSSSSSFSSSARGSFRGRGQGGQGRGRSFGRRGGRFSNNSFVRNNNDNEAPITASNKWVRPATENNDLISLPPENDGSKNKALLSDSKAEETITYDVHKTEQNLERRGRNKLIIKKKNEPDVSASLLESNVDDIVELVPTEYKAEETITSDVDKPEHTLKRRGRHQLVMKTNKPDISSSLEDVAVPVETKKTEKTTTSQIIDKAEQILERRGRHKLVLKKDETETMPKSNQKKSAEDSGKYSWKLKPSDMTAPSNNDEDTDTTKHQGGIQNERKRAASGTSAHVKRKRPETIHGPRRICLSSSAATMKEGTDADRTDEQPQKTMTDFQYKDASARGRGRGKGKAMGLVRVKPKNPSETPICPTFSRGLPCNNPKCRLRHDVSTEASRPICVFFQRNGMCSKGDDCPFKHVKISWDAEICPTFEKLGYCEDEDCVLRHVARKRSKTSAPDKR